MWITMKTTKLRNLCLSILVIAFVINAMAISLVHAAQTIPGVERLEKGIADYENGKYEEAGTKLEMALDQISNEDNESLWKTHFYLGLSFYLSGSEDRARKEIYNQKDIFKNRLPDFDLCSPKIVGLFKKSLNPKEAETVKLAIDSTIFVDASGQASVSTETIFQFKRELILNLSSLFQEVYESSDFPNASAGLRLAAKIVKIKKRRVFEKILRTVVPGGLLIPSRVRVVIDVELVDIETGKNICTFTSKGESSSGIYNQGFIREALGSAARQIVISIREKM